MWSRVRETVGGSQWCIAKNGGGYTQRGVAKGLKVPCLFMITEVTIRCQKNPEVGIRRIPAYTPPQYTTGGSVFPSACLSHSPAAAACGGFAAVGRTTSIDCGTARRQQARPPFDHQPHQHGGQQQMRAVSCSQPRQEAEHRLARTETAVKRTA